jgi:hypothetical protein
MAPGARIGVDTDWSVPRALERVVQHVGYNGGPEATAALALAGALAVRAGATLQVCAVIDEARPAGSRHSPPGGPPRPLVPKGWRGRFAHRESCCTRRS